MTELPKVSIVIVNLNGKHLLSDCFESIKKLNYPKDKVEVVVVDNGSKDGSADFIREKYKDIKLITNATNEGFAKPSNDGARAATGEYVAFLNNDMRVHKNWLRELIESLSRNNAECAGSLILDWSGKLLDFASGGFSFQGYAFQNDFKRPIKEMESKLKEDKEILFACGGAMIVKRDLFLNAGGFDEDFFAYYEDVDLGWRLRVLGCKIVLSVKSRVDHKHNATSKSMTKQRVQYLFERNKLYTCYKNYGEEFFTKAFLPSVLLDVREAVLGSGIDPENYDLKNPCAYDDSPVRIKEFSAMKLAALNEFIKNIGKMAEKRRFIQENRKATDESLNRFMTEPFRVFPKDTAELLSSEYDLIKAFEMDKAFGKDFKKNAAIVLSNDGVSESYKDLAEKLIKTDRFNLYVAAPNDAKSDIDGAEAVNYTSSNTQDLAETLKKSSIVILSSKVFEELDSIKDFLSDQYVAVYMNGADLKVNEDKKLRYILETGDFFIVGDENEKSNLVSLLNKMGKTNSVHPEIGVDGIVSINDTKALVDFSMMPYHCNIKDPDDVEEEPIMVPTTPQVNAGATTALDSSAAAKLDAIYSKQLEIQKMLKLNNRNLKETSEEIGALTDYSKLMNARFLKLKSALSKIKIFRRFVG